MFSVIKNGREKSFKKMLNETERIYLIIFMARNGDTEPSKCVFVLLEFNITNCQKN